MDGDGCRFKVIRAVVVDREYRPIITEAHRQVYIVDVKMGAHLDDAGRSRYIGG